MDMEPIQEWSDTVGDEMGLSDVLENTDEQTMGLMEGLGGLLSCDVKIFFG